MSKKAKNIFFALLIALVFSVVLFLVRNKVNTQSLQLSSEATPITASNPQTILESDFYLSKVQPIFNARCVACHSCYNSPCQLDLTSFEGLSRGANKKDMHDFSLLHARQPTRLGIDGKSVSDWRAKNFFPVIPETDDEKKTFQENSTLWRLVNLRRKNFSLTASSATAEDSRYCPNIRRTTSVSDQTEEYRSTYSINEVKNFERLLPFSGMPYLLPPLNDQEMNILFDWSLKGSPGPSAEAQAILNSTDKFRDEITMFENFFNAKNAKARLSARYIYEHLFLAHLYFKDKPVEFFRLVRARNQTGEPDEIATDRPYDDPGKVFFYRFKKYTATIVQKNHIPYLLSQEKLATWKRNFIDSNWTTKEEGPLYGLAGANPFTTFYDIPPYARSRFLIDDSYYHIMTFIKGPVCNGQIATNVIEDNFWVFFMNPTVDIAVNNPHFFRKNADLMDLPAEFPEGEVAIDNIRKNNVLVNQSKYDFYKQAYPEGLDLSAVWDGDGFNKNAILTVYRHNDSAAVLKGAHGQVPKTIWVLDYPLFEDIYYNLVAGYNVFGSTSHQVITRKHMDHSRVDATDLFISLLPENQRKQVRNLWTRAAPHETFDPGRLVVEALLQKSVKRRMESEKPYLGEGLATKIKFNTSDPKTELVEKIFSERMNTIVRGSEDRINGCKNCEYQLSDEINNFDLVENWFATISGMPQKFSVYLPDVAYVRVTLPNGQAKAYTLVHNREHFNVSFLLKESARLDKKNDSINFIPGYAGSYPNIYFDVKAADVPRFIKSLKALSGSNTQWKSLTKNFAVSRWSNNFWPFHDWLNKNLNQVEPIDGGLLDLNRYTNEQ